MLFGKEFKVLKELPIIFKKVGDKYPEYFLAYEENGLLEYYIMDDIFGQQSPSNWDEGEYSQKIRKKASRVLQYLLDNGYIEFI